MFRAAACALLACTLLPTPSAAQFRNDDVFSRSADDWCRDDGRRDRRDRDSHCVVRDETLTGLQSLDVDTGGNGGINVRGSNRSDIRLRYRIMAWARDDDDARDLVSRVSVSTANGRVRVDGPRNLRREGYTVAFEIEVPRTLTLRLNTHNGGIALDNVAGRTDAETVNGGLRLQSVAGDLRGRTVNGGVNVDLDGPRWDGVGLDLETVNGGVQMRVPENFSAQLQAETTNGGVNVGFPITVQGRLNDLRRRIDTTIGNGGPRVRVRTVNGGVRIERR